MMLDPVTAAGPCDLPQLFGAVWFATDTAAGRPDVPVGPYNVGARTDLGDIGAIFDEIRQNSVSWWFHGVYMV